MFNRIRYSSEFGGDIRLSLSSPVHSQDPTVLEILRLRSPGTASSSGDQLFLEAFQRNWLFDAESFFGLVNSEAFEILIYSCAKISHLLSAWEFKPTDQQLEELLGWTTSITRIPNSVLKMSFTGHTLLNTNKS